MITVSRTQSLAFPSAAIVPPAAPSLISCGHFAHISCVNSWVYCPALHHEQHLPQPSCYFFLCHHFPSNLYAICLFSGVQSREHAAGARAGCSQPHSLYFLLVYAGCHLNVLFRTYQEQTSHTSFLSCFNSCRCLPTPPPLSSSSYVHFSF